MGASLMPQRYSNKAIRMLREYDHEVVAVGGREGQVLDVDIEKGSPEFDKVHTVTLYLGEGRQTEEVMQYILQLRPKRVIFNPGTENWDFKQLLRDAGIEVVEACTLVMLRTGQY